MASLNDLQLAAYKQMRDDFKLNDTRYLRYIKKEARVRTLIISTVAEDKQSFLDEDESVRHWFTALRTSTKPSDSQMEEVISGRHRTFTSVKYLE